MDNTRTPLQSLRHESGRTCAGSATHTDRTTTLGCIMNALFKTLSLGDLELPNRIVMAPMTRCRAEEGRVPGGLIKDYYVQRASAGLIISEATSVDPMGVGYPNTPGIWTQAQTLGWRQVTRAVHNAGGRILCQLWHAGRVSHPSYLGGAIPVSASAIPPEGHVNLLRPEQPYPVPRALSLEEIPTVISAFKHGAENALAAGFDGVEIHGANGYLIDQFLEDRTNARTDAYGGSIENRARLLLEVTDAVISVWGPGRVGMHLSPRGDAASMGDSNPPATFGYVARELGRRKIAFVCTRERAGEDAISQVLKEQFGGPLIANEGFTPSAGADAVASGRADAVAFAKLYIANPDLCVRIARHAELNTPDPKTFYASGPKGYIDYPSLDQIAADH